MAAYWFVTFSGASVRYQPVCSRIVSTRLGSASRGGATGSRAKKRKPIRPEMESYVTRRTPFMPSSAWESTVHLYGRRPRLSVTVKRVVLPGPIIFDLRPAISKL
jgi:hypothetical protein